MAREQPSNREYGVSDGETLRRGLNEAATLHPISELRSRGIESIRLLNETRLHELVREAVKSALRDSIGELALPDSLLEALEERSQEEARRLIQAEGAAPHRTRETAPGASARPQGSVDLSAPPAPRMIRDLTALIETDWQSELAQVKESQRQQLELLERRISKLVKALDATDQALAQLKHQHGAVVAEGATGFAVNDGTVAGVNPTRPLYEKKSQLLEALFEANLKLRELESSDS